MSAQLHIEPFGGLAGDMLLAALLDLKDSRFGLEDLRRLGDAMVPGEWSVEAHEVKRGGLRATHLDLRTEETKDPPERHYSHLVPLVGQSGLGPRAQERALAVLWRLAVAEAKVHGTTPENVHFHEVGAVDTLIDVCGTVLALELLEIEAVTSTPPVTGEGTVRCAHGEMPVPVPAVVELMRGRPMQIGGAGGERLTPTGAAILAELSRDAESSSVAHVMTRTGYGAGTRDPKAGPPNLCRVQLLAQGAGSSGEQSVTLLEVNLDDQSPEEIGFACALLREAGALEVWTQAIQMKKDRPGVLLSALARRREVAALEEILFEHTTTFGVRRSVRARTECSRDFLKVKVRQAHEVRVKVRQRPGQSVQATDLFVEHDDLVEAARATGASLAELRREALQLAFLMQETRPSS